MGMLTRRTWLVILAALVAVAAYCHWSIDRDGWRTCCGTAEPPGPSFEEAKLQIRYLHWSCLVRDRIARALIRGELTLSEAAACFQSVNARRPPGVSSGSDGHPGSSEEERLCRHVLEWVRVELADQVPNAGLLLRLEAELEEQLRQSDLRLPALPPGFVERFDLDRR
jgi:hypothetical protein